MMDSEEDIHAVLVLESWYDLDGDIVIIVTPQVNGVKDIFLDPDECELPEPQSIIKVRKTRRQIPGYQDAYYSEIIP